MSTPEDRLERAGVAFWSEPTSTWLCRDERRQAFKNVAASPQPPAPLQLNVVWRGALQSSAERQGLVRAFVALIDGGYYAGMDASRTGGASWLSLQAHPELERARVAAQRLTPSDGLLQRAAAEDQPRSISVHRGMRAPG